MNTGIYRSSPTSPYSLAQKRERGFRYPTLSSAIGDDPFKSQVQYFYRFEDAPASSQAFNSSNVYPSVTATRTNGATFNQTAGVNGTGALICDAGNQFLAISGLTALRLADFTLEWTAWTLADAPFYEFSTNGSGGNRFNAGLIAISPVNTGSNTVTMSMWNNGGLNVGGTGSVPAGSTFVRYAVERFSGTFNLYVEGTRIAQQTVSVDMTFTGHMMGYRVDGPAGSDWNGRVDNARLTMAARFRGSNYSPGILF